MKYEGVINAIIELGDKAKERGGLYVGSVESQLSTLHRLLQRGVAFPDDVLNEFSLRWAKNAMEMYGGVNEEVRAPIERLIVAKTLHNTGRMDDAFLMEAWMSVASLPSDDSLNIIMCATRLLSVGSCVDLSKALIDATLNEVRRQMAGVSSDIRKAMWDDMMLSAVSASLSLQIRMLGEILQEDEV